MANCKPSVSVSSYLPEYARDAHGNLAEQNRLVGPVRGQVTVDASQLAAASTTASSARSLSSSALSGDALFQSKGCVACHGVAEKKLGPSVVAVADRYAARSDAQAYLASKIKQGSSGVWGDLPMPSQGHLSDAEIDVLASWFLSKKK